MSRWQPSIPEWKKASSRGNIKIRRPLYAPAVDEDALGLFQIVSSPARLRILVLLATGVDHPEELGRKLKLRRQGVDKQLLELYRWGFVDRSAILPAGGRPRIVYRISNRGQEFLDRAEALVREYHESLRAEYRQSLDFLENKLAAGEIEEEAYLAKRQELEARYAPFLGTTAKP